MIRLLLSVVMCTVSVTPMARADDLAARAQSLSLARKFIQAGQPRAFQSLRATGLPIEKISAGLNKIATSKPAEMSIQVGKTLLFLLTVTGVDIVKGEIQKQAGTKVSNETIAELVGMAATQILDNGGTYLSILGASLGMLSLDYPAQALSAWIANPQTRPILHKILRSNIMAVGTTATWDAGAQLWTEGIYLLETPQEFQRIQSLFGTAGGALKGLFNSSQVRHLEDLALIKKMAKNIFYVALVDQDLRSQWIDNTLRTRIMTGEFAVLSAALATAAVGTIVAPGGGSIAGFVVGVVAVTAAINVPAELKDAITGGLHAPRLGNQQRRMATREIQLLRTMRPMIGAMPWINGEGKVEQARALLESRRTYRSSYMTICIEKIRLVFKGLFREGTSALPSPAAQVQLQVIFSQLHDFFTAETKMLEKLESLNPSPSDYTSLIEEESRRVLALATFFNHVGFELNEIFAVESNGPITFKSVSPRAQEFIKFVEVGYARGFKEELVYQ